MTQDIITVPSYDSVKKAFEKVKEEFKKIKEENEELKDEILKLRKEIRVLHEELIETLEIIKTTKGKKNPEIKLEDVEF